MSLLILVVDDEPAVRVVLTRLLTLWGLQVTAVANGAAARDQLTHQQFNVVFSDLGMAGMNGWEVLAAVKKHDPAIRTFLVTGWGEQIEARRAQRRGADYVIAKPFQHEELRALVQDALVRHQGAKL